MRVMVQRASGVMLAFAHEEHPKQPELHLTRPADGRSADDLNVGDNVFHLNHNIDP